MLTHEGTRPGCSCHGLQVTLSLRSDIMFAARAVDYVLQRGGVRWKVSLEILNQQRVVSNKFDALYQFWRV